MENAIIFSLLIFFFTDTCTVLSTSSPLILYLSPSLKWGFSWEIIFCIPNKQLSLFVYFLLICVF